MWDQTLEEEVASRADSNDVQYKWILTSWDCEMLVKLGVWLRIHSCVVALGQSLRTVGKTAGLYHF